VRDLFGPEYRRRTALLLTCWLLGYSGLVYGVIGAYGSPTSRRWRGRALFFAPLLMILFRRKYPRWWFDWNLELQRFTNRVTIYLSLMDDRYPATDNHQSVHLDHS
jgi:hypothetical protein